MDYPDQRCIRSIERHAMSFSPRPRLDALKQKARDEMGVERYEVWPLLFVHTLHPSIHPRSHATAAAAVCFQSICPEDGSIAPQSEIAYVKLEVSAGGLVSAKVSSRDDVC